MKKARATIRTDRERNSLMRSCWIWAGTNLRDYLARVQPRGRDVVNVESVEARWENGRWEKLVQSRQQG